MYKNGDISMEGGVGVTWWPGSAPENNSWHTDLYPTSSFTIVC